MSQQVRMVTASHILGTQVGSTAPVFLAFLALHVLAGITAVITGATAALARKGSPRHIRAGRWYYRAITVIFTTAAILAAMRWRQDYYLFILGTVAFAAATVGYQHRRHHQPGDTGHIAGMGAAYVTMLTAFYVDNGPHLSLWGRLPTLAFWLLPSAVGAPIITRAIIRARRARGSRKPPSDRPGTYVEHTLRDRMNGRGSLIMHARAQARNDANPHTGATGSNATFQHPRNDPRRRTPLLPVDSASTPATATALPPGQARASHQAPQDRKLITRCLSLLAADRPRCLRRAGNTSTSLAQDS